MHRYTITLTTNMDADSAEEAALLAYQALTRSNAPVEYSVADEKGNITTVLLDRTKAEEFATEDHTVDPGNW